MNYYNPYFYSLPNIATSTARTGLFSRLFGNSGITFSGILNGTQKALNFANQAIPLVKQVRPMIGNAKTMFKVMNEFKKTEKKDNVKKINKNINNTIDKEPEIKNQNDTQNTYEGGPIFFM